jgi:heptosyltransferase I
VSSEQNILIVRLGALGDVIHSLPVAAALRQAYPAAHIGWAIEERWAELLGVRSEWGPASGPTATKPLVDSIHIVKMKSWLAAPFSREGWRERRRMKAEMRAQEYGTAIDIQGALKSVWVARASSAPKLIGFSTPREPAAKYFYKQRLPMRGVHVVEQGVNLVRDLSERSDLATEFRLPRDPEAEAWRDAELKRRGIAGYVVITPGAGWGAKRWPSDRYGEVARTLGQWGLQTIVNAGPGEEHLAEQVVDASGGAAQALSCSVGQLIALARKARLFIGGDTGPVHLAAALGVNVVAVYGPTDPARNGPYGPDRSRAIVLRDPGSKTSHARNADPEVGLLKISAQDAFDAAKSMLREPASDAVGEGSR